MSGRHDEDTALFASRAPSSRPASTTGPNKPPADPPTVDVKRPAVGVSGPLPSTSGSTTVGSPLEALERDEMLRTRRFCAVAFAIAFVGGLSVFLLPGDHAATLLVL